MNFKCSEHTLFFRVIIILDMSATVLIIPTFLQWMVDAMLAKGHNMTYSKFRVGGSAVQVSQTKI